MATVATLQRRLTALARRPPPPVHYADHLGMPSRKKWRDILVKMIEAGMALDEMEPPVERPGHGPTGHDRWLALRALIDLGWQNVQHAGGEWPEVSSGDEEQEASDDEQALG